MTSGVWSEALEGWSCANEKEKRQKQEVAGSVTGMLG